jgi:adenine-specific DNA methylase
VAEPPYDNPAIAAPIRENLALTERGGQSVEVYRNSLHHIFCECRRVLKKDGVMVFTYHHKSPAAWGALGSALVYSGLKCATVLPLRGEGQGGLHSYDGTIKWDAVFVCRKGSQVPSATTDNAVVSRAAIKLAKKQASGYAEDLAKTRQIGFRDPDRLNLERAMIVASAVIAPDHLHSVPLADALKTSSTGGR